MEEAERTENATELQPMDEEQLKAVLGGEVMAALGYWSDRVAEKHERSMLEYLGEAYGDEREGFSQVVSRDIFETVQWILPDLLETFVGGDEVVRQEPTDEHDEELAKLASARLNHVFLKENPGFEITMKWMLDAMIQDNGIVKCWVEESPEVEREDFPGLDDISLGTLMEDQALRLVAYEQSEDGLHHVEVERTTMRKRITIENIPPEEFGISRDARTLADARCVYHLTKTTAGALRELGYPEDLIAQCPSGNEVVDHGQADARRSLEGGTSQSFDAGARGGNEAQKEVLEAYLYVDFDGDGRSELRRVIAGGRDATVIFANDEVAFVPFADLCAIPIPHRFYGMSVADALTDLQRIRTTIFRQYLDALYGQTRPRTIVTGSDEQGPFCDVDQLQNLKPMGFVTEYVAGAIRPFPIDPQVPELALQGLEFMRSAREDRMGVSRVATGALGMEPDAASQIHGTARGIEKLQQSANKRVAMIARIFAETGFKTLFKIISRLMREIEEPVSFQHRGEWQQVGGEAFRKERDVTLSVGLGYGDRQQRYTGLMTIAGMMERILAAGLGGRLVDEKNAYNLMDELCDVLGYKNATRFFTDPKQAPPAPPPQPDQWLVETAAKERMHAEDVRLKELQIRLDYELGLRKLALEGAKIATDEAAIEAEAGETVLPLTGGVVPSPQSQRAAEPGATTPGPAAQPNGGAPY